MPPGSTRDAHVLVVTPGFPADRDDTTCLPPVQLLLEELARSRPDIGLSVISLHYPDSRQAYRWRGMKIVPLGAGNRPWPLRLTSMVRGLAAARRLHATRPIDLVHALWLTDAAVLASLIARHLGVPMTASVMGQDALPSNRYLRLLPLSRIRLTAASDRAAATLLDATGSTVHTVIPWGLDPPRETPSAAWSERSIDLLGVGALTANKDYSRLLQLCRSLLDCGRACTAVLIGDGPQRAQLERQAARLGLGSALRFKGYCPRADVLEHMARARILVHPARFEGFGFVFSEALAMGMSVVSRPVGAAQDGPRWRLYESDDELVAACADLMDESPTTEPIEISSAAHTAQAYAALFASDQGNPW